MSDFLNPSSSTTLIVLRWLVFIACVLMWAAFVTLWRCRSCDTGGRMLVLLWVGHTAIWLSINSIMRLFFAYVTPTVLLSLWATTLWIQAAVSVLLYVTQWRHGVRRE